MESDGEHTIGLSTIISDELKDEGFARELVHYIQNSRKEAGFEIENTINTAVISKGIKPLIKKYKNYIMKETLTKKLVDEIEEGMYENEVKVNGKIVKIGIKVEGSIK